MNSSCEIPDNHDGQDKTVIDLYQRSHDIAEAAVTVGLSAHGDFDRTLDDVLTSKVLGIPIMVALLGAVFWVTLIRRKLSVSVSCKRAVLGRIPS